MQFIELAEHAEQYIRQRSREQARQHDRPDHFGDVAESRRDAFQ
jgi:hypothetical protein